MPIKGEISSTSGDNGVNNVKVNNGVARNFRFLFVLKLSVRRGFPCGHSYGLLNARGRCPLKLSYETVINNNYVNRNAIFFVKKNKIFFRPIRCIAFKPLAIGR